MNRPVLALAFIRRKLNAFNQLEPEVRSPLLQALALLPLVHQAMKILGFQRTYRILLKLSGASGTLPAAEPPLGNNANQTHLRAVAQAVRIASCYHPYATCLRRSLVLWYLLHRQRVAAELHIGSRFHNGEFQAHAWVEWGDNVVGDRPTIAQQFPPFDMLNPMLNRLTRSL